MELRKEILEVLMRYQNPVLTKNGNPLIEEKGLEVLLDHNETTEKLLTLIQRSNRELLEEVINKIDNIMDEERAKDIGNQLEEFTGSRACKVCGIDAEYQRKYILRELNEFADQRKKL